MSKTSEKNSISETVKRYWKQSVGWATDLRNKYWHDVFFRTEFNVIALQIVFAIVVSVIVAVSFDYLYKDILQTLLDGITQNLRSGNTITGQDLFNSIQIVRAKNFLTFFGIALSVTLLFSYIIARMTLSPARNALKYQKRFVSDIAHELRTPLAVIKTNMEVALLDDFLNVEARNIFRSSIEELDRASGIINNLLTFSKLVHPEQIQFSAVDIGVVIDTALNKLEDLRKKKDIKITVKKISPHIVWGNMIALEQIIGNIVKNAINYTSSGGSVFVTVEPDYRGNIIVSIADTGIGISQKDLVHIFEPFYRAEASRNRATGSSGLGLTIVSELVKLHAGRIQVRSKVKQGTTVTVVLPYSKEDEREMSETKKIGDEVTVNFLKDAKKGVSAR
jgi:signal transduction histidine kinase